MSAETDVKEWEARGQYLGAGEHNLWVCDLPAISDRGLDPLLVLHGYPTCSYDARLILDNLRAERRVVMIDFLGFGLSDKPDLRYSIRMHADHVENIAGQLGLQRVAMFTHDMGDSVGGELLARSLDGTLAFDVSRRVLTNGSIYIEMAHLSTGQQLLLAADDAPIDIVTPETFIPSIERTFSERSKVDPEELEAQWLLLARNDGQRLLARTIRYIEDRRKEERRYTGAIEAHPSPVGVVWGADDPIAIVAMTDEFVKARPGTPVTILDNVGHYPMIESPRRFADAVCAALAE
jgi:pimeloyl-ACP methyl ester carboxylesterase